LGGEIYFLLSIIKNKKILHFKFDKVNQRWKQYDGDICCFADFEPNWRLNLNYLKSEVVTTFDIVGYTPKEGDVIIDVGAGVGTETLIYSMMAGKDGKVFAIEAHPETFQSLKLMIETNKIDNVIGSNVAVSDKIEKVFIETRENHVENRIFAADPNKRLGKGEFVQTVTLDDYVETNKIEKINFLKMNIEGAELLAIKGMTDSIKKIDHIAIACHDFFYKDSKKIKKALTDFLKTNDFKIISIPPTGHIVIDSWIYATRRNAEK
jgi:FkbM family methyltransferase